MGILLTKMEGAGNDFLIADFSRRPSQKTASLSQNLIQNTPRLCGRRFGIGADGLCLLLPSKKARFEWKFFNSDGSKAKMCGNAACCLIHYMYAKKRIPKKEILTFIIEDKKLSGSLGQNKEALLEGPLPRFLEKNKNFKMKGGKKIKYDQVEAGVPHVLIQTGAKNFETLRPLAKKLRKKHPQANITFYRKEKGCSLFAQSFERGVEDFTLSCGTGALALAFILRKKDKQRIQIQMKGGGLSVFFKKDRAYLYSPVHFIADISPYHL